MGNFIAKTNIPVGEAFAYTRGQTVTAEAVKTNDWQDHVVGEDTKEAREIKAEITGRDPSDFETKPSTPASRPGASAKTPQEG